MSCKSTVLMMLMLSPSSVMATSRRCVSARRTFMTNRLRRSRKSPPPPLWRVGPRPSKNVLSCRVAAGLIIGALIGAGSAWLVYSQLGNGSNEQQHITALSSRVDALDRRPNPQRMWPSLQSGLAEVQGKVASLEKQVTGSSKMTAAATPTAQSAGPSRLGSIAGRRQSETAGRLVRCCRRQAGGCPGLDGKISALEAALGELKTRTAALQAQDTKEAGAADKIKTLQGNLSDAQKQVVDAQKQAAGAQKQAESAQSALASVKSDQKQIDDKLAGLTIAVAGALKKATVRKSRRRARKRAWIPFKLVRRRSRVSSAARPGGRGRQLGPAGRRGAALHPPGRRARRSQCRSGENLGVARERCPWRAFSPGAAHPVEAALRSCNRHGQQGSGERPTSDSGSSMGCSVLVSVRRADTTAGNDLVSRVNLIESDLAHDDVPGAYAIWQALPADAKGQIRQLGEPRPRPASRLWPQPATFSVRRSTRSVRRSRDVAFAPRRLQGFSMIRLLLFFVSARADRVGRRLSCRAPRPHRAELVRLPDRNLGGAPGDRHRRRRHHRLDHLPVLSSALPNFVAYSARRRRRGKGL